MSLLNDIDHFLCSDERESHDRFREGLLTSLLASGAGLAPAEVARISIGGLLHDLGKISVPDHILGKRDRLNEQEYEVIKTHPDVGLRLLAEHPLAALAEAAVRSHHETPDGKGYPSGLIGDAIELDARIVGICDAFDAMTSTRPYRRGMSVERALSIIEEHLSLQFDREYGQRFVDLERSGQLDHIVGHSDEDIPLHKCAVRGPTVVLKKGQAAGEHVYCRSCAGEYVTEQREDQLVTVLTGSVGTLKALIPSLTPC